MIEWQPLSSIPKNEKVLLWIPGEYVLNSIPVGIADPEHYPKGIYRFYGDGESARMVLVEHATHWRPLQNTRCAC